jgi:hypothetical protein
MQDLLLETEPVAIWQESWYINVLNIDDQPSSTKFNHTIIN